MKRLVFFVLTLCLLFSLCACGSSETDNNDDDINDGTSQNDTAAQIGDILDRPEKLISFADLTKLTLKVKGYQTITEESSNDSNSEITIDCVYSCTGESRFYWIKTCAETNYVSTGTTEPSFEELYCAVENGREYAYVSLDEDGDDAETAVGEVLDYLLDYEVSSNEQLMKETFAYYGIDYKNGYSYKNATFKKCADEKVNGFDCYVYDIVTDDISINYEKIYVDKETGLWVKDEVSGIDSDVTYTEVFEIISYTHEDSDLPSYIDTKFD